MLLTIIVSLSPPFKPTLPSRLLKEKIILMLITIFSFFSFYGHLSKCYKSREKERELGGEEAGKIQIETVGQLGWGREKDEGFEL